MRKLICPVIARFAVALVCLAIPSGLSLAQSNYQQQQQWQRQQEMQRQQDMQRQQMQEQQRQQMQQQQRQQMQEQQRQQMQQQQRQQMQTQQRQQMQEQQRQQMQSQQRQQMQTQQRQQTADQQRQQMQRQGALNKDGKPTGVVVSGGTARMARPLTPAEIQKGFTGRVTSDGRALIKYQGRVFAVPASRVAGLSARLAKQRADRQAASAQSASTTQRLAAIAAAGGGSGREPPNNTTANARARLLSSTSPAAVAARLETAQSARLQDRGFKDDSVGAMRNPNPNPNPRDSGSNAKRQAPLVGFDQFAAHGLKAERIRAGAGEKVAVIGRSMGQGELRGVRDYAKALRDKGVEVEIFDGDTISGSAKEEFQRVTDSGRTRLTNQQLLQTRMYKENKDWVEKLKREGYTVIDIGNPTVNSEKRLLRDGAALEEAGFSPFYALEKQALF